MAVGRAPDPLARRTQTTSIAMMLVGVGVAGWRLESLGRVRPDGTETVPVWSVALLLGVWAAVVLGLHVLARHPEIYNYPVPVTEESAPRLYELGVRLVAGISAATSLLLLGILLGMTEAVTTDTTELIVGVGVAVQVGLVVVTIARMLAAERPAKPGPPEPARRP